MALNDLELGREDITRLLEKLDHQLHLRGHSVTLYVVGGANIALTVDQTRTTTDIDAVIKEGHEHLSEAAAAVARTEPGLAADWVNSEFTGERIFRVQGSDGIYPRIDPAFPHIFDNLPPDLAADDPAAPQGKDPTSRAINEQCGLVKVKYRNGSEIARTKPCSRKRGHVLPHRFK